MNCIDVKPALLRWARQRAGLSADKLARRFPKLADWESGDARPTLKQLEGFARATYTPVGFLFLPEPPVEHVPLPDFRTVASAETARPSPNLLDTVYLCQQRQDWYREHARTMGYQPFAFVGSARVGDDVVSTAARIRETLGLDLEERRQFPTWADALRHFIGQADDLGVLVMVSGVVGSNTHRKLDPQEFRGFALADELAPLVFINGADTRAAQMFTLAHELAHIWLGQSAVSDAQAVWLSDHEVERWCNQVAVELLVSLDAVRKEFDSGAVFEDEVGRLARHFKVSTLVVLRRIHDAGGLSYADFKQAYAEELKRLSALVKGSGGNFYLSLGARASKTFARAVVVSTMEGHTSFTEAFRMLGVKKTTTFNEVGRSLGVGF